MYRVFFIGGDFIDIEEKNIVRLLTEKLCYSK